MMGRAKAFDDAIFSVSENRKRLQAFSLIPIAEMAAMPTEFLQLLAEKKWGQAAALLIKVQPHNYQIADMIWEG